MGKALSRFIARVFCGDGYPVNKKIFAAEVSKAL
jgi:hypothetical protein